MFIIIHYTDKRIVLLNNGNLIDDVLGYFIKNTGSSQIEISKQVAMYGYYEKSNLYLINTNHSVWTNKKTPYGIRSLRFENINNFIKIELRNIMIDKLIS